MAPFSPLPPAKAWEEAAVAERSQVVYIPLNLPLGLGPPRTEESAQITDSPLIRGAVSGRTIPAATRAGGGQIEQSRPGEGAALSLLSPVLCVFFYERAYEPARLSRAFSRRASGKRSGA